MADLRLTVENDVLEAEWLDTNTDTRTAVLEALPVAGEAARWGEELYLHVPVESAPDDTQTIVEPGTLAYWPDGPAICLFWGPTPASTDEMPVAASPVAPLATVLDTAPLEAIDGGASVRIETAD